jgi:hypothetical protein
MLQPCPVFAPSPSTTQFPVPLGPVTPTTVPNVPPEVICSEKEVRVSLVDTLAPVTIILTKKPPDPSGPPDVNVNVTPPVDKQLLLEAQVSALAAPVSPRPSRAKTATLQKNLFITSLFSQVHTGSSQRAREKCNACTKGRVLEPLAGGHKSFFHRLLAGLPREPRSEHLGPVQNSSDLPRRFGTSRPRVGTIPKPSVYSSLPSLP